jgi:hypothetical protein
MACDGDQPLMAPCSALQLLKIGQGVRTVSR